MKRFLIPLLFVATMIFSSCASSFSENRAKEVTPQFLASICRDDPADHIAYFGSDSTYHYFFHVQLFGGGSYKVEKREMRYPEEFPLSSGREPPLLIGRFDETTGSWISR
jgi:hypothetical protein